jgi:hypothetical protein
MTAVWGKGKLVNFEANSLISPSALPAKIKEIILNAL